MKWLIITILTLIVLCVFIVFACLIAGSRADDQYQSIFDNETTNGNPEEAVNLYD